MLRNRQHAPATITPAYPARISAMRDAEITVNGQTLGKANAANWKDAVA